MTNDLCTCGHPKRDHASFEDGGCGAFLPAHGGMEGTVMCPCSEFKKSDQVCSSEGAK